MDKQRPESLEAQGREAEAANSSFQARCPHTWVRSQCYQGILAYSHVWPHTVPGTLQLVVHSSDKHTHAAT